MQLAARAREPGSLRLKRGKVNRQATPAHVSGYLLLSQITTPSQAGCLGGKRVKEGDTYIHDTVHFLQSIDNLLSTPHSYFGSFVRHQISPNLTSHFLAAPLAPATDYFPLNLSTAAVLVAVLVATVAMSWRDPFDFWRRKPSSNFFRSGRTQASSAHNDQYYTYLTDDDIDATGRDRYQYRHNVPDDNSPDILLLKHRGVTYPLHFAPYAIDDGTLTVGELRRRAAEKVGQSDLRRIKLLYKGKLLRDNERPCKDEGLKQESEVMCVVSQVVETDLTPSFSGTEEDLSSVSPGDADVGDHIHGEGSDRDDELSSENRSQRKKNKKKKRKKKQDERSEPSPESSSITPEERFTLEVPAPSRPPLSPRRLSGMPSPAPSLRDLKPGTEQVEALRQYLESTLVPFCEAYIADPPRDPQARELEHKRLTETIMDQVILKADCIEVEEARPARRALIKEAQAIMARMDQAKPGPEPEPESSL